MANQENPAAKARFIGVWVLDRGLVYVRALLRALDAEEVDHTAMLRWMQGTWGQYMIHAPSVSHCVIREAERTVLTLGPDGTVHTATPAGFGWEKIDDSPEGPNSLRMMSDIRPIGESVYAAGMSRMVYRRASGGRWSRFDTGMRGTRAELTIGGFLSIDGHAEDLLYAVGFKGEMWCFETNTWKRIESPTNLKIERVRAVSPELAVACGGAGTILMGSRGDWGPVVQDLTDRTFWGLEYFNGRFYLADGKAIYTLDGTTLSPVDLGLPDPVSPVRLHAGDGVLWSVGESDMLRFDGRNWERVTL